MCQGERGYLPPQAGCLQHFTCQLNVDSPLPIREGLHPSEGPYAHAAARKLIDAPQAPPGHAIPRLRSVSVGTFVSIVSVGTLVSDVSIVSVVSVLKKSTRKKPLRGPGARNGQAAHHHHVFTSLPNRSPSSRRATTSISAPVEPYIDFTNLPSQPLWHWENASRSPGGPPTSAEQKYGPCG